MKTFILLFAITAAPFLRLAAQQSHINIDWDPQRTRPDIESHYNVIKNKHSRAISGLSMGGRHAQYVGLNNLSMFGSIGILSAAIPVDQTPALKEPDINSRIDYLFVGAGTHETRPGARHVVLHEDLEKMNVSHEYYIGSDGAHDLITWRHLLYYRFIPSLWKNQSSK